MTRLRELYFYRSITESQDSTSRVQRKLSIGSEDGLQINGPIGSEVKIGDITFFK